ncbi:MAG: gamma-glutamyltransferase [Alphaproteobacteria bacterium]|nr:gamma-glutamyltransferase [Alphaproteobacteria bacterium]
MRDFQLPGRSTIHACNGIAATSHPFATLAAINVLQRGGNAVDAAITASAVLCAVEAKSTGIGGDCFILYVPRGKGKIIGLNGSGRAPMAATADWYLERGIRKIEQRNVHAITIPGAIDAWDRMLKDHGTIALADCLEPAIRYCEEGAPVSPRTASDWTGLVDVLSADPTMRRIYLPGGKAPSVGDIHKQPELGRTMRLIAKDGPDAFYRGEIAEDIVNHLRSLGGLHALDDFAQHRSDYVTPIKTGYRGYDVYQIPPNGQGITALIMLNVFGGLPMASYDPEGPERLHIEAEAARIAYHARDRLVADPDHASVPVAELLSASFADQQRRRIRIGKVIDDIEEGEALPHATTIYLCVVDKDLNAISFINSTFLSFGSGIASPKTGVVLQNRGAGFVIRPGHPNCIAPAKRPLHTIIPGMVMQGERALMPYGVMGAQYQPTGHAHVLSNVFDYGMDLQEALDCPRAFHYDGKLQVERGVPARTVEALRGYGHKVAIADMPLGGGQMIWLDWERGALIGGSEPRKDGCALGY